MAKHKKADFARYCGKATSFVTRYIERGKLIAQLDKKGAEWIDDEVPLNREFVTKWRGKLLEEEREVRPLKKVDKDEFEPAEPELSELDEDVLTLTQLEKKKKEWDLKKVIEETAIKKLQKEKLQGASIPTEDVKVIFGQAFKQFTIHFIQASQDFADVMVKQMGGNKEDKIEITHRLETVINEAIEESKSATEQALKAKAIEYAYQRGRGQSKIG